MTQMYGDAHRRLQDDNGTRALADRLEQLSHAEFLDHERAFLEAAPMFFLSTVDGEGRPTVSYKGGAPGFVRVTGPGELVFPSYDGNGMFLSLGNIAATAQVGLLFIDFERPQRLRVQGRASLATEPALAASFPGARYVVRVAVEQIFVNCGRYIHPSAGSRLSRHVPDAGGRQPFPAWKRIEVFEGALTPADLREVGEQGGFIPLDAYAGEDGPPTEA